MIRFRSMACVLWPLLASTPLQVRAQWQASEQTASVSLDSLLNTRISVASKYAQRSADAPASVSIVTGEEIRRLGFRDLLEVLETVRGFYASNDRNYPYLGTRGFGRPTDYNNRLLVLIDGHTLNDQTWGGTPVGSDLPVPLIAIERIEVSRGPGAVQYGTNAMFGVVNVVTRSGDALDGVHVATRFGTGAVREVELAAGSALGASGAFSVSGLLGRSDGLDRYFPEWDAPETNNGTARGLDWERRGAVLGSLAWPHITVRAGIRSREKGIPTGAYGVTFGDARAATADQTLWGNVTLTRAVRSTGLASFRLYADRYQYWGTYPYGDGPAYRDGGGSRDVGAEGLLVWDATSRHRLSTGVEYRRTLLAEYYELHSDGSRTRDDAPTAVASAFVQHEMSLTSRATVVSGVRFDHWSAAREAVTPRFALMLYPAAGTTLKLLYGHAFRAPSPAEADIETSFYSRNPVLKAERIRTAELIGERRFGSSATGGVALFTYRIDDLIDQVANTDGGGLAYRNVAEAHAEGVEVFAELTGRRWSARAAYSWQDAHDQTTDEKLANSPDHVATVSLMSRLSSYVTSTVASRAESGRLTLAGPSTAAFVRTDVSLAVATPFGDAATRVWPDELVVRLANAFDQPYSVPAGVEHTQIAIPQDGRTLGLTVRWHW